MVERVKYDYRNEQGSQPKDHFVRLSTMAWISCHDFSESRMVYSGMQSITGDYP
jgi:hypothetical protein